MRYTKQETADALESFRRLCPPGTKIRTILRHVSRSGMSRNLSLVAVAPDGTESFPNWCGAVLTESPSVRGFNDAIKIGGCGMDIGLALVDSLSYAAYGVPCIQGRVSEGETPNTIVWAGWL